MPLQSTDKKLEDFTGAVIKQATDEASTIARELREKQNALIGAAETQISAEAEGYAKAAVADAKAAAERRISAKRNENKHTVLRYREACANEIHHQVQQRIAAFTASEDYLPHLKKLLAKAIVALGYGISVEVFLRAEDAGFADELFKSASGVSLAFSEGKFSLGGLCVECHAKGRRIDMSFDTALNDMVGHVSELTGLKMGE
ncbi:MAG: hypothetical protein LBL15_00685 [Oscillospiraceae bacterium]|jgi:vacuolar-type H+-ATPase subunit E/Vma4|nr:hypothetical protein [Oscillospiraceae bacterium]